MTHQQDDVLFPLFDSLRIALHDDSSFDENEHEAVEFIKSWRPQDIDALAQEFGNIFQLAAGECKINGMNLSPQRQLDLSNEYLKVTTDVFSFLVGMEDDDIQSVATLFVKTFTTPTNLKALLTNIDADDKRAAYQNTSIQSELKGYFRCNTMMILRILFDKLDVDYLSMKMDNKGRRFSLDLLDAYGKVLHDEVNIKNTRKNWCICMEDEDDDEFDQFLLSCERPIIPGKDIGCKFCIEGIWIELEKVLRVTKDDPFIIIDILDKYDWTAILESFKPPMCDGLTNGPKKFYDTSQAQLLVRHAINVILIDKDNIKARNVLRKVGRCRSLVRRFLQRIISAECYTIPPARADRKVLLTDLCELRDFYWLCIRHSLDSRCIIDEETIKLVDRAGICLRRVAKMPQLRNQATKQRRYGKKKASSAAVATTDDAEVTVEVINFAQDFTSITLVIYAAESEEKRIESILANCERMMDIYYKKGKKERKAIRHAEEKKRNIKCFDMCANCFVTETALKREEKTLLRCGICKMITYCSRECQLSHWQKHKQVCKK